MRRRIDWTAIGYLAIPTLILALALVLIAMLTGCGDLSDLDTSKNDVPGNLATISIPNGIQPARKEFTDGGTD